MDINITQNDNYRAVSSRISTPERIIAAAVACFSEATSQSVTLGDIARQAGVSRRTLYHHFLSREEIFDAACAANMIDFIEKLRRDVSPDQPFADFVTDAVIYIVERAKDQPLFNINTQGDMAMQVGRRYFNSAAAVKMWVKTFQPAYIRALQRREINPEIGLPEIIEFIGRIGLSFLQHPRDKAYPVPDIRRTIELCFTNALKFNAN